MVDECYFKRPITNKLYECKYPAMCALQTPYEGVETLYCIMVMMASKKKFIESELEKKLQEKNEHN
jgi:hypothetical protein